MKSEKANKPTAPAKANPLKNAVGRGAEAAPDDMDRKYRAEDGLRTLTRAEEIRRDGALMKDIENCRQAKMRDLASIKVQMAPQTMKMKK